MWLPISPQVYLDRIRDKKTLLVYARYDLTFPVDLSRELVGEFERRGIPHELAVLPCGHYSTGVTPFKYPRRVRAGEVSRQEPVVKLSRRFSEPQSVKTLCDPVPDHR